MLQLRLPAREDKPREIGLSNLVDNGYGIIELSDKLDFCGAYIDIVKLGWASAYITENLVEKVALFKKHNIRTCPGGMMFELCWWQRKIGEYIN